jgi:hypothetical protein
VASSDDLAALAKQLTAIETHAKATLSWVAEARKTMTALVADTKLTPPPRGFTGGL